MFYSKEELEWYRKVPDSQREAASNSYLMSLVAVGLGMPMPIVNLFATLIFYFQNRKEAVFVRYHCMQALLSQVILSVVNAVHFGWLMSIFFGNQQFEANYIGFMVATVCLNLAEFISNINGAMKARKGQLYSLALVGPLSAVIYQDELNKLINETAQPQ